MKQLQIAGGWLESGDLGGSSRAVFGQLSLCTWMSAASWRASGPLCITSAPCLATAGKRFCSTLSKRKTARVHDKAAARFASTAVPAATKRRRPGCAALCSPGMVPACPC